MGVRSGVGLVLLLHVVLVYNSDVNNQTNGKWFTHTIFCLLKLSITFEVFIFFYFFFWQQYLFKVLGIRSAQNLVRSKVNKELVCLYGSVLRRKERLLECVWSVSCLVAVAHTTSITIWW